MADHVQEEQEQRTRQEDETGGGNRRDSDSERRRANPRRKRTIRFIILAFLVVALIAAIPIYTYYSVRESTDDAQVDGHIVPISPRISGTIIAVLVLDNQPVKAGQELVRLDPADYQVAYEQAAARLANAEASVAESTVNVPLTTLNTRSQVRTSITQVDQYVAGVNAAQQAVNAARARLNSAQALLAEKQANSVKRQKDLARMKNLVEKDEISKQDYDAALAAAEATQAEVNSAKADIVEAQDNLEQAAAEVEQARARLATARVQRRLSEQISPKQLAVSEARHKAALAQVKQGQADLDQAKLNLGYTTIRAPLDGVISRKSAEPGMRVSPGQQITALVPLDDVWITANFKETQLKKMRFGQHVEIEVDTYGSSRKYNGHIDSIAPASGAKFSLLPPENATGNYVKVVQRVPVKIVLEPGENRDHRLLPGMSVTPTVLLNTGP
ncbi:MAG: HlyD family secretion protein [Bryobacteraceae bacterium]